MGGSGGGSGGDGINVLPGGGTLIPTAFTPINGIITGTLSNPYRYSGQELLSTAGLDLYDYGVRQYSLSRPSWLQIDPLCERYYSVSPYSFCAGNPVNVRDNGGRFLETAWDVANIVLDVTSLKQDVREGKVGAAIVDVLGFTVDAVGAALPFVPAGAGAAIKAARTVDKAAEARKTIDNSAKLVKAEKAISSTDSGVKWSKSLRNNMIRATGEAPEGMHAHHVLPKKFERQFREVGMDINDPKYGRWMESHHHLSKAREYNKGWEDFLQNNHTAEEIERKADELMKIIYGQ